MPLEAYPKVVRGDAISTITMRPAAGAPSSVIKPIRVTCIACDSGQRTTYSMGDAGAPASPELAVHDGALSLRHRFDSEQVHTILVQTGPPESGLRPEELPVYSLADDLFWLRPHKGDFHMHSRQSDGREPPAHVAAACRRIGMDFMALTDHRLYAPSLEAARAFERVELDLGIYPGEEIHPPGCPVHLVNFGGRFSVNALFGNETTFRAEIEQFGGQLGRVPPGVDRHAYAATVWCCHRIREADGLSIFCHPYWVSQNQFDVPEALTAHLLKTRPFDALELIGGYPTHEADSNTLQVARYREESMRGGDIPLIGASDAHGCETGALFGWYYSIVFAPTAGREDIVESVRKMRSVAVDARPGEVARIFGPFRLVKFALFLLREVFPRHDRLCEPEGRAMLSHLAGDAEARERLRAWKGRAPAFIEECWGPSR